MVKKATKVKIKVHKGMTRIDLARKFSKWGFRTGVEVGTQAGHFAETLCKYNKNLKLYTLDAFELVYGDNYTGRIGERRQKRLYYKAQRRLAPYKCMVIKGTSVDVLKHFDFESLDVFPVNYSALFVGSFSVVSSNG